MRPACCRTRPDFGLKWPRGRSYRGKLPKPASADNPISEITPSENCKMTDEHGKRMLRELMRFACEPQLDAMTRSWIFDALRNLNRWAMILRIGAPGTRPLEEAERRASTMRITTLLRPRFFSPSSWFCFRSLAKISLTDIPHKQAVSCGSVACPVAQVSHASRHSAAPVCFVCLHSCEMEHAPGFSPARAPGCVPLRKLRPEVLPHRSLHWIG